MWEYTEDVKEHYRNPKNVGEVDNANATGEVGSLTCGDMLKLTMKIDDNNIIQDAKAQTFGCGSAVASASVLTEMIIGKTVEEAEKITNKQLAEKLGGLPPAKMHCSVMGQEALEAAIANFRGEEVEKEPDEKVVCKCYGTTEGEIKSVIKDYEIKKFDELSEYCKTGSGCTKCCTAVKEMIDTEIDKNVIPVAEEEVKLTPMQMILKINKVLELDVAPKLNLDGGDIELIDVSENVVTVSLKGACSGCASSQITLKNLVEGTLKEKISKDILVKQV